MKKIKTPTLTINQQSLTPIHPITKNQQTAFEEWKDGNHLVLAGSAGTGKTFLAMYFAFDELFKEDSVYDRVVIIRSAVATRDQGHLPGDRKEKEDAFAAPYKQICSELFEDPSSYGKMLNAKQILFETTSYIRGVSHNNSLIIVDEMQNLNFHELDTVITRVGKNSRIIFSGDYRQTDFRKDDEKTGIFTFMNIIEHMNNFSIVTFGWEDIVRSGLVRDYIMTKEMLGVDK